MSDAKHVTTMGSWAEMVQALFDWALAEARAEHGTQRAAAKALGLKWATLSRWANSHPRIGSRENRTEGYEWSDEAEALIGPGFAMVMVDGLDLVVDDEEGERVRLPMTAVLETIRKTRAIRTAARPWTTTDDIKVLRPGPIKDLAVELGRTEVAVRTRRSRIRRERQ